MVRGELIVSKGIGIDLSVNHLKPPPEIGSQEFSIIVTFHHISTELEFLAYEVITTDAGTGVVSPLDGFKILEQEGFHVVKYDLLEQQLSANVMMLLRQEIHDYPYVIDGIVLTENHIKTIPTVLKNPVDSVAFKCNMVEQMRETVVTGVAWNYTRHGRLVPIVEFRPVFIDGARIHRAFVYNASTCLKKYQLGLETTIVVTRSGGVIPTLVNVLQQKGIPCAPQVPYPWHWSGADIVLDDPDNCPEVLIERYVHFFETLEIAGIRDGMVKRMVDGGLKTLPDILMASKERLRQISGIQPNGVNLFTRESVKVSRVSPYIV